MGLLDRWTKRQEQKKLKSEKPAVLPTEKTIAKPVAAQSEKPVAAAKISLTADKILIRPLVTEKSAIAASHNKYGFVVERSATKSAIKRAIAEAYGVIPTQVNLINVSGKSVRFGQKFGRRSDFKKALVTLPAGKTISIHEGV